MMAHLSQDKRLMQAYAEFIDVHQQTADICGCDRSQGKVTNLGLIYEMAAKTLTGNLGWDWNDRKVREKGTKIYDAWHAGYPNVRVYQEAQHVYAQRYGYVRTITGRIRFLPGIYSSDDGIQRHSERAASNSPCQGSVADVIDIAMKNLFQEWRERGVLYDYFTKDGKVKIVSQVHDELIVEARKDFAEEAALDIRRHMEGSVKLTVPMTAIPGIGHTWLDAKADGKRREKEEEKCRRMQA